MAGAPRPGPARARPGEDGPSRPHGDGWRGRGGPRSRKAKGAEGAGIGGAHVVIPVGDVVALNVVLVAAPIVIVVVVVIVVVWRTTPPKDGLGNALLIPI